MTCKALQGSITCHLAGRFREKNGSLLPKNRSLLLRGTYSYSLYASLCILCRDRAGIKPARVDLRSVVADSGPINRFGVWTQPVMYGSLEPREFKDNSNHNGKSKHDSLFTDLP